MLKFVLPYRTHKLVAIELLRWKCSLAIGNNKIATPFLSIIWELCRCIIVVVTLQILNWFTHAVYLFSPKIFGSFLAWRLRKLNLMWINSTAKLFYNSLYYHIYRWIVLVYSDIINGKYNFFHSSQPYLNANKTIIQRENNWKCIWSQSQCHEHEQYGKIWWSRKAYWKWNPIFNGPSCLPNSYTLKHHAKQPTECHFNVISVAIKI